MWSKVNDQYMSYNLINISILIKWWNKKETWRIKREIKKDIEQNIWTTEIKI